MGCNTIKGRTQIRNLENADQRFAVGSSDPCADDDNKLNIAEIGVNIKDETLEVGVTDGIRQVPLMEGSAANNGKVPVWSEIAGKFQFGDIGGGGVTYGNVLFVSATGNNGTAIKGDITKPWLNIKDAVTAAVSGDTIYQIGDQTISTGSGNLAKNGLKFIIQGNLTSTLDESLFDDLGATVVLDIFCTGTIRQQDAALGSPLYKITDASSKFTINVTLSRADSMVSSVQGGEMVIYGTMQGDQKNVALVQGGGRWYHEGLIIHNSTDGINDDFAISMNTGVAARVSQIGDLITFTKGTTSLTSGIINFVGNDKDSRFSFIGDTHCKGTGNNGVDSHLIFTSETGQFNYNGSIYANNLSSIFYFKGLDVSANIHLQMNRYECLGDSTYARGVFEDLGDHIEEDDISVIIDGQGSVIDGIYARIGYEDSSFPVILKGRVHSTPLGAGGHGLVLLHNDTVVDGLTIFIAGQPAVRAVITQGVNRELRIYSRGFQSNVQDENTDTPGRIIKQVFTSHYIVGSGFVQ